MLPPITHVAIWRNGLAYALPSPSSHAKVRQTLSPPVWLADEIEGFLDARGQFLNRHQAYYRARLTGQLRKHRTVTELAAEDIW